MFFCALMCISSSVQAAEKVEEKKPMPFLAKLLYSVTLLPMGTFAGPGVSGAIYVINEDGSPVNTMKNYYTSLYAPYASQKKKQKWHEDRYKKVMEGRLWKEKVQEEIEKEDKAQVQEQPNSPSSLTNPAQ